MESEWTSGKYGAGQAGREHYKSRVMNVMHIDFFPLQKTETGRDEGFFQVEEEKKEEQWLAHASNIFPSIKKKKESRLAAVLGSQHHAML